MTEDITVTGKPEQAKSENNAPENTALNFIDFDCQCESRFLYSSPCLLAEIEEDEDFLSR